MLPEHVVWLGLRVRWRFEPQPDEQVVCQDLTGELSNSLSEIRKEMHRWKTKWRHVFVSHKPKSLAVVWCHERELCGFAHGDEFIITVDSTQMEQMNLDGASVQSVRTPAVKLQEWMPQVLAKLDRDRTSTFRSATMRASHISTNIVVYQTEECPMRIMNAHRLTSFQGVKTEVAGFETEPNEESMGACSCAWFDTSWMCKGIEVPTTITLDACLPGRA